jgi:hypothetical protein
MPRMSETEVLADVEARVKDAVGYLADTLSGQREKATKYYRGDAFGNEEPGRSQVVSRDVAQNIDTVMPSLMRIFSGSDEIARFQPSEPGDEEASQQATDYVNWIWTQQNDGFVTFHHWFKDGLMAKLGTIKIWWDDAPHRTKERYFGLNEQELAAIQSDKDIEVGDIEVIQDVAIEADGMPAMVQTFNVDVVKINREGRIRIEPLPPECFLFGRRARNLERADILAHRDTKTQSELIEAGYDKELVAKLFANDTTAFLSERLTRFVDVDNGPIPFSSPGSGNGEVEVIEAYLHLDVDGDGIAEYVKVCYSGSYVLDIEEVDDHPFACVTPILMPHRLVGMSMSDQLEDIQLLKSTVWRQAMDNLYLSNMPQMGVVEGAVNLDDVLTRRPGGVIRMKQQGAILPIPTQPLGREPFQMIEYLDTTAEQRTGATRYNQGLDADTLNKTATGINIIQNAAAQRIELIARIYAETGVKRAFRRILELVCKHQQKARVIRLRNQWVEMDPRGWKSGMDLSISVGLGTGNKDQVMSHMMSLLQLDEKIVALQGGVQGPLLTAGNIYAKLKKLLEAAGLKGAESYYTDPDSPEVQQMMAQQPPKQDPKAIEAQAKIAAQQAEAQARMQQDMQKAQHDATLAEQKLMHEMRLAEMRLAGELEIAKMKAGVETEIARMKAQAEAERAHEAMERQEGRADVMSARERAESE